MGYDVELAKMLKERNNINKIGATTGTVVNGGLDYKIAILDNTLYLNNNNSKLCNILKDRVEKIIIDGIEKNIEYNDVLKTGDSVLVIPTENNQFFYVIDKI